MHSGTECMQIIIQSSYAIKKGFAEFVHYVTGEGAGQSWFFFIRVWPYGHIVKKFFPNIFLLNFISNWKWLDLRLI